MEPNIPAVVGEVEAGRAAKVLREINKLIKNMNNNEFDVALLLHEAKSNHYYSPLFESFSKYAKSLNIKYTRAYYYVGVIEQMKGIGVERETYEPIGMSKLRVIARLKIEGEYKGTPMPTVIKELVGKALDMSLEEVTLAVETILGLTEDESMVWLNVHLKKLARDNAVKPALALAKKHMPESQTKDEDGNYVDPGDGAALEMICANFLADPNFNPTEEEQTITAEQAPEQELDDADAAKVEAGEGGLTPEEEAEILAIKQQLQDQ